MEQGQGSQSHYWIHQAHRVQEGNGEVQIDCHGDTGEPLMDNLLDRSGLFDELVCQILDESQPSIESEVNALNEQQSQPLDHIAIEDSFQGLNITSPAANVPPTWTKSKTEMMHETPVHPSFPPGITERPTHPALFDMMYQAIPTSGSQGGIPPATRLDEQSLGMGKPSTTGIKSMPEYCQPSHFMKGDHHEAPHFNGNFSGGSMQGNVPSSGGDCGGAPLPMTESQYGTAALGGLNQRNRGMGFRGIQDGRRGSPVPEDPHQYFRQRVSAAHQTQPREQFPKQSRPALPFPINEQQQAMNMSFAQNLDLKTQLMQMNSANNWANFNKLVTKGNVNLRTSTMAFDPNQVQMNMNAANASYGQNRLPNYQFSLLRMPSQQGSFPAQNQNHSQHSTGLGGQFQQHHFPVRPEFYNQLANQNMTAWQQSQLCPQNDNQNYLGQLHVHLESCYYQFYSIEKERKKTEIELSRLNPGRRISSANTIQNPQLPENPTSLDRMIVDFYKEHSRVYTLMSKIGGLCAEALHPNIDACLDNWVEAIQEAGVKRRDELRRVQDGITEQSEQRGYVLVDVIQKLAKATRSIRTALWCALQMSKENKVLQNDGTESFTH